MTEYDETAPVWHLITVSYGGNVSILKNLDAPTARQAYQRLAPRLDLHGYETGKGGRVYHVYPRPLCGGDIRAVDVLGPEGVDLDPWRGIAPDDKPILLCQERQS